MDILGLILWFSMLLILMVINFIGFFKLPFLQIISMMFLLFLAVPMIVAFEEYAEIPAILIFLNVVFAAYGIARALKRK